MQIVTWTSISLLIEEEVKEETRKRIFLAVRRWGIGRVGEEIFRAFFRSGESEPPIGQ